MASILHYTEVDGSGEYIVITDVDLADSIKEEFCEPGYVFCTSYDIDSTGTLPTERSLRAA